MTKGSPRPLPRRLGIGLAVTVAAGLLAVGWLSATTIEDALGERLLRGGSTNALASIALRFRAPDLEAPSGQGEVEFEVAQGETVASVATRLEADGLILSADAFGLLARVEGLDTGIQAGLHAVPRGAPAKTVLEALQLGRVRGAFIGIPEGLRAEEIAELFAAAGMADPELFLDAVRSTTAHRAELDGVLARRPVGAGLEGFLFPDTYEVEVGTSADGLVAMLTANFLQRYAALVAEAELQGLDHYDVVILASIVEREASLAEERRRIGRVFRNRLEEPPYLLGADPTVQYALGLQESVHQWWKRPLTLEDLKHPSPYNSYVTPGLPPGPIANPGLAALEGVVRAEAGPWMFFVANEELCDGSHVFAVTFEEHQANVARYRTGTCVP